jgi:hypothetical protein
MFYKAFRTDLSLQGDYKLSEYFVPVAFCTGTTLIITCNFLYCNHQVHREFLITLYLVDALRLTLKPIHGFLNN